MAPMKVCQLRDDLSFGTRISGVTEELLKDELVKKELNDIFWDRGVILFEDVEPSGQMHLAVSRVFGPLKSHPIALARPDDKDGMMGILDIRDDTDTSCIVEIEGRQLATWLPWHFDHCFNNELNRASVLRAMTMPPDGGMTGFADGIDLYDAISPVLRDKIEGQHIIYVLDMHYEYMRFCKPEGFRVLRTRGDATYAMVDPKAFPRAVHPAVWTRTSGEKVLHVSPWGAVGIKDHEDPEGDELLLSVCDELLEKMNPYFHKWKPTDMVILDNWRMLHSVNGHDPKYPRHMKRTTIEGDYGLGYFENKAVGNKALKTTV